MSNNDNGPRGTIFDKIYPKGSTLSSLSRQNNQSEESINSDTSTSKSNWTPQPPPPLSTSSSGVGPGYSTSSLYSSVKRLNLFPKRLADTDSGVIYNSNSFKRFRNNNNIDNLSDSVNEPSARSRVSHVSTPSSTSSVAFGYLTGEFGRKRYPRTPLSVTGRDSPSLIMNSLNLSSSASNSGRNAMPMNQNRKPTTGSYFYTGKTTFGGSNLRKNIHRLSMTPYSPYSRVNVKCIEPTAVQRPPSATGKSISHSTINEELPLSSVTQRILDRLDKAAAPISDAKSRIPISTLISNSAKKFDISRTPKLFDTPTPIIENRDRSHIDSNFKPMKYILKPSSSFNDETSTVMAGDKSIDDDIQKLNQIKQAEKELKEQQEKVQTKTFVEPTLRTMKNFAQSSLSTSSGKITARDVKKGRKIDDVLEMDDSHLKSLANVQPLATMTTGITLKPFSLNSSTPMNHSDKSNTFDIRSTCDKTNVPNCSTINNEFSFKFSSPKLVASLSPMAVRPTFQEIDFSSPIQISESKPIVQSVSSTPTTTKSLFDQFKHRIQSTDSWTCQICCTQNDDINADKCIACEEHNPHKKSSKNNDSTSSTVAQKPETIKFGDCNKLAQNPSFSSSLPSLNHLFKKDTSKNWTCPTCSVSNNIEENRCISCEEPNPHSNAKTSTSNNQMNNLTKFSFGSISTGINSDTSSSTDNSSTITKQPSLFDVIQKKKTQDKQQWTCPTCMVPNESNVDRCVSCEEPNPNQPVANQTKSSTTTSFGFKFGVSNTDSNNSCPKDHSTTIAEEWQCFYCKALNKSDDISKNVCNECGKIKVMAATKDQVQKFYQTQTFKFGLSTGVTNKDVKTVETKSEKQDKTSNDITTSSSTSGGFKFGAPSSCNVSNSPTMTSPFASSKTAVPFLSFGSSPSLSSSLVKPIESKTESKQSHWFYNIFNLIRIFFLESSSLFSFGTTTNSTIDAPSLEKTTKPNTGTTPTASVSSSSSNLFVFGDNSSKSGTTANNNDKESLNEDNNKTITPFGFNAISSTSSTNIKPPMATGLFSFGGAKPLDSSKPSLSSSFSKGMKIILCKFYNFLSSSNCYYRHFYELFIHIRWSCDIDNEYINFYYDNKIH